jgi:hypothetical protein
MYLAKSASADHKKVVPAALLPLFPGSRAFDLDTSYLDGSSFHHEDVISDIYLRDGDIDAAMKQFRHYGQVPTPPEEGSLAAHFSIFLGLRRAG